MPQPLPDVGTSVPQVKSGHPPPHRYTVGRPDRLSPALWSHHSGQRAAWKRSPELVHWPGRPLIALLGSQGDLQRRQAERKGSAGYLLMGLPLAYVLTHSFPHSLVQDQPCQRSKDDQPLPAPSRRVSPSAQIGGDSSSEKCVKVGLVRKPTGVRVSFCIE